MRWLALIVVVAGCFHDELVPCGELSCPVGDVCVADVCASPDQLAACSGQPDGTRCSSSSSTGVCTSGVCISALCGNGKQEAPEACDDGNLVGGDGCSAQCDSTEVCGNGVVDYLLGEQCDQGIVGQSGDGCSSTCAVEIDLWRDVTTSPPLRQGVATTYDSARHKLVTFGGYSSTDPNLRTTWEWDGAWDQIPTPAAPPRGTETKLAYDSVRKRTVLFGGYSTAISYNDTWEYDGVTWTKRSTANAPSKRVDFALTYDPEHQVTMLFGGTDIGTGPVADTWAYDGTTWSELHPTTVPAALSSPAMTYDPYDHEIVLFGDGQTWTWNGTDWALRDTMTTALTAVGLAGRSDGVVMHGGFVPPYVNDERYDTYLWHDGTWTQPLPQGSLPYNHGDTLEPWGSDAVALVSAGIQPRAYVSVYTDTWVVFDAVSPLRRVGASIAFDPVTGRVVMFGGSSTSADASFNDTWEWDGSEWMAQTPTTVPPVRSDTAAAFDEVSEQVFFFGGIQNSGGLSQAMWSWDSANKSWSEHLDAGPRPAGGLAGMVYLPAPTSAFLIVTNPPFGQSCETWQYRPAVGYTQLSPAHPPSAAADRIRIAYDRARDRVVLFNGLGTWEWDGTDWSGHSNEFIDPPVNGNMTYDATLERVLLFGGAQSASAIPGNRMFSWDGTSWTQLTPALSPTPRFDPAMTFDPIRNRAVIVGGIDASVFAVPFDTWVYGFESGRPTEDCTNVDSDKDGLVACADPDCAARCVACGDGTCGPLENYLLCPGDCPVP